MQTMKCEQCGRLVDDKPCPFCQSTRVRPLKPGEVAGPPLTPEVPAAPRAEDVVVRPAMGKERPQPPAPPSIVASEPEPTVPPTMPPSAPLTDERWHSPEAPKQDEYDQQQRAAPEVKEKKEIRGLAEFEALLTGEHFKAVVVCGKSNSGKSEIASGFTRANTYFRGRSQITNLRAMSGQMYTLGATVPDEVWYQVINTRRRLVFLDPSGEFFKHLSPIERQRWKLPDVTPDHFRFVRSAVDHLAAVVLVVDLTSTVDGLAATPWLDQEIDLDFTLSAIRFLRHDKTPDIANVNFSTVMASRLPRLPRLDVPVLVLFSKADLLDEITYEAPLRFAQRRLPRLHASLRTHARRFRFDFVRTMESLTKEKAVQVERPCGALLSMEWLLSDPFRWMPCLPTRFLEGFR